MAVLQNKIDFALIIEVHNANPNGDPLNGNRPRENYEGFGEISDVCIKRKLRNRLQDMGESIFVQSDDKRVDNFDSLRARADSVEELKKAGSKKGNSDEYARIACEKWMDVRSFGQVFAFKGEGGGVSVGVRGPVSLHPAFSVSEIDIESIQITKSVNSESTDKKGSDTMGMKHRVDFGVYTLYGSINVQLAEKTGFSEEDAGKIKEALRTLFVNDSSSARPDGSMEVNKLYWWKQDNKTGKYSSAKIHRTLSVAKKDGVNHPRSIDDYDIKLNNLPGLEPEVIDGI